MGSCADDVDESNLYVFSGKTVTDYVKSNPELSDYYLLLQRARSGKHGSTMDHLLETRGHYTVFAPTNAAVRHYLDSVFTTKDYDVEQTPDSVAHDIVFNSIIDCGTHDAYPTTSFMEGTLEYKTMADRFATVSFAPNDSTGKAEIYINAFSKITGRDNEAENGWMHVVNRVVMPYNSSLPDLIAGQDNLRIFSRLLSETGWADSLQMIRDEVYENKIKPDNYVGNNVTSVYPQHRYYGYTAFVEPDSVLCAEWGVSLTVGAGGGVSNWPEVMERIAEKCREYYPSAKSADLTSGDNAVNQFVSYHIIHGAIPFQKLVIHYNEVGYAYNNPNKLGIDKMEYFRTLGSKPRLLKLTEGEQTDGKRINRYVSEYDWDTYYELSVPRAGIRIYPDNGSRDIQALNGFYYPIDGVLVYDDDVPDKVLNERIRFDVLAMQPELYTNNMRALPDFCWLYVPRGFCDGISFTDQTEMTIIECYGRPDCRPYEQGDAVFTGEYDVTFKLLPVPYEGMYELRMAAAHSPSRGMMQVYVGTDKYNLTAIGLPIDMRYTDDDKRIGWFPDTEDLQENIRREQSMRNHNIMKGPACFGDISTSGSESARNGSKYYPANNLRNIIYRGMVRPDQTYYVRFKNVLTNPAADFDLDYFEWVPKSVYAGVKAEDIW